MAAAAISTSGESIGAATRRRLAGFARTLRDNGFKVGTAETRDALAILTLAPAARRPSSLKPALRSLLCATHSDWERFDEIFDAFWLRRGLRQARTQSGSAPESRVRPRRLAEASTPMGAPGLPGHREWHSDSHGTGDGSGK